MAALTERQVKCFHRCRTFCSGCLVFFFILAILVTALYLNVFPYAPVGIGWYSIFITLLVISMTIVGMHYFEKNKLKQPEQQAQVLVDLEKERVDDPDKLIVDANDLRRVVYMFLLGAYFVTLFILILLGVAWMYPESFAPSKTLSFARIAGVNSTSASFFIRDYFDTLNNSIKYRKTGDTAWLVSNEVNLTAAEDYTTFIFIQGLENNTQYEWFHKTPANAHTFKTYPSVETKVANLRFYFGSCFVYNFPSFQNALGFDYISTLNPDFIAVIGDFIYADAPWFKGYETLYRQVFSNVGVKTALTNIPNHFMIDDHEITNNWDEGMLPDMYVDAMKVWRRWVGNGNVGEKYGSNNTNYFSTNYGDVGFFYLDSRSHRDSNKKKDDAGKTMLGSTQKQLLKDWLVANNNTFTFKFLISSVPWTSNAKGADSWGGFLTERSEIFDFILANHISGIVFLSGDAHIAWARTQLYGNNSGLFEFSSSPLSAFTQTFGHFTSPLQEAHQWSSTMTGLPMSIVTIAKVNTQVADPFVNFQFYDKLNLLHNSTLFLSETITGFI